MTGITPGFGGPSTLSRSQEPGAKTVAPGNLWDYHPAHADLEVIQRSIKNHFPRTAPADWTGTASRTRPDDSVSKGGESSPILDPAL